MIWVALKMVYTVEKNDLVEVPHPMFIHVQDKLILFVWIHQIWVYK